MIPHKCIREDLPGNLFKCTTLESNCNFFFRQGDPEHMFQTGQDEIKAWQNKSEDNVLFD